MENQQERTLREYLNTLFTRYNYVGIKNILSEPFEWAVALEQNEILSLSNGDNENEQEWLKKGSDTFLPMAGAVRGKTKLVTYSLNPGERKIVPGEAAYILIDKIYTAYIKEQYVPKTEPGETPNQQKLALTKAGMAKIRNPHEQQRIVPMILVGPIINKVDEALQTFVSEQLDKVEGGFTDVQTRPRKAKTAA